MREPKLQLISHALCPYVQRSVIVLEEKKIPFERIDIDLDNLPTWFKAISPMQRVPLLRSGDDRVLFESAVICEYLNETTPDSLHPTDSYKKARHRSWIEFGSDILNSIAGLYSVHDHNAFEDKRKELQAKFQLLEHELTAAPYFSGENFSLIDAVYGPIFRYFDVFEYFIDLEIFDRLPKILAWRCNLQKRLSVKNAVAPEYPQLLTKFIQEKASYLSSFIAEGHINVEKTK